MIDFYIETEFVYIKQEIHLYIDVSLIIKSSRDNKQFFNLNL